MRTNVQRSIVFLFLVSTSLTGSAQALQGKTFGKIDSFVQSLVDTANIPGIAMAITLDDRIVHMRAFGVASKATGMRLETFHNFHIASISKTFTATAVMQLAERGKIDIDQPLTSYLSYFRMKDPRYRSVTIKQLLNHTSGMPDVDDYEWEKRVSDAGAAERYARTLKDSVLISEPGKEFHYSNVAFDIMADIVAKVSGQTFEDYVKQHMLLPLEMKNSSFIYPDIELSRRTSPHINNPAVVSTVYPYNRMHAPSSTLNTNAEELAHWAIANLHEGRYQGISILMPSTHQQMMTPTVLTNKERNVSVGLSWFSYPYRGSTNIEHGGSDTGYRTMLTLIPDKKLGIVLLCNHEEVKIFNMRNRIRDILLDVL
jgi:CubicO group peptidase (beta-lactamase class C family)